MIKQLLNSAIPKYRDLSVARRSIICLCLRHRQIIDLLATDKSRYFSQSRPIIVYYRKIWQKGNLHKAVMHTISYQWQITEYYHILCVKVQLFVLPIGQKGIMGQ